MTKTHNPPPPQPQHVKVRVTVSLDMATLEALRALANKWNAADRAAKVRRPRVWQVSNLCSHFVCEGLTAKGLLP